MSHLAPCILLLSAIALPGCTHPVNARLELGSLDRTPTFVPTATEATYSTDQSTPLHDQPRTRWNTTVFIAPIDGIAHGPTFRLDRVPRKDDHPRTYGLFPTTTTAIDHQTAPISRAIPDSIDELGVSLTAFIDPLLFFYEMNSTPWSPRRVWKRSNQDTTWSSGQPPVRDHQPTTQDTNHD